MSGLLQHLKVSAVADGTDTSQVQPSDWNAAHVFAGGNHGAIPIRDTADATYGSNWLASVAAGQVLVSNGVGQLPTWSGSVTLAGGLTVTGQTALNDRLTVKGAFPGAVVSVFSTFDTANADLLVLQRSDAAVRAAIQLAGGAIRIGTTTAHLLELQTSGIVRASIAAGGGLTITGQTTLQDRLTVTGAGSGLALSVFSTFDAADADFLVLQRSDAAVRAAIQLAGGAIRIGTTTGHPLELQTSGIVRAKINAGGTQTWAPYGAGTATFDASGNITSVSDARLKDRIAALPYGLAAILQLRPVQYGYTEASGLERDHLYGGFLAHDVQAAIPLAVGHDPRGYLTLADRPILGAVVHAIQTLDARLASLEGRR